MKALFTLIFIATAVLFCSNAVAQSPEVQDDVREYFSGKVKLRVDGIACPFCSRGLEKKLSEISGVEQIEINIEEAFVVLTIEKDKKISRKETFDAVKKAGFTPVELTEL